MNTLFSRLTVSVLAILFLALPFSQAHVVLLGIPLYVLECLTLVLTILYVVALLKGECRIRLVPYPVVIGFIFIFIGMTISSIHSAGISIQELGAIKSWVVFPALFGFLLFQVVERKGSIWMILSFWYAPVLIFAMLSWFPGIFSATTFDGRLTSLFPSPNHFSFFLLPGTLIGSYFFVGVKSVRHRVMSFLAIGLISIALCRTQSQGAIFSSIFGLSIMVIAIIYGKRAVKMSLIGSVILFICFSGLLYGSGEWSRLSTGEIRTPLASRVMIWNAAFVMLSTQPIFGIGPRNFQDEYLILQKLFPPYLEWTAPHPHNIFLSFWLSGGIFSFFGFLMLVGNIFKNAFLGLTVHDPAVRLISILMLSLGGANILHGLVDDTYFRNDLSFVFWAVVLFSSIVVNDLKMAEATGTTAKK